MHRDGDGWVRCAAGHRHWGVHGSAGLLLRGLDETGRARVLMQHRAAWTHDGDTWGVPGGARDSHESPAEAALREAVEEAGLDTGAVRVRGVHREDHDGWAYDTVVADCAVLLPFAGNDESAELRWVPEGEVVDLALHPGFARSWPLLRAEAVTLVVDAANVVGSRPDGWWRDRAAATARLVAEVGGHRGRVARLAGGWVVLTRAAVVVEGAAREVGGGGWARTVRADGEGDDDVVALAGSVPSPLVVTADRGLRARLPAGTRTAGPRWLLGLAAPPAASSEGDDGVATC